MRITQGHLYARAVEDVNRGLRDYVRLQEQISTGRRVNRPSDDPAAALRIIPLTNDIKHLQQYTSNVAQARDTLDQGAASLEDASSLMQRLRELTTAAANGTLSQEDRAGIATEIDGLLRQMVEIANSKQGNNYLFGGTATSAPPFRLVEDGGGARVEYSGNHDRMEISVAPGVETAVNIAGDAIFQRREPGAVTITGTTGAAATGNGDTAVGFQNLAVTFAGLHTDAPSTVTAGTGASNALGPLAYVFTAGPPATLSIGGGPAVPIPATDTDFATSDGRKLNLTVTGVPTTLTGTFTAKAGLSTDGGRSFVPVSDFTSASVAVRNSYDGTTLMVDVRNLRTTGTDSVEHAGTFDSFTVLITLRDLLRNAGGLPGETVRQRASQMLTEIDGAHDSVLDGLRELGYRSSSMEMLGNRVAGLQLSSQTTLSSIQDTDLAHSVLELNQHDLGYQAALQISARVIQTTLQNYLR